MPICRHYESTQCTRMFNILLATWIKPQPIYYIMFALNSHTYINRFRALNNYTCNSKDDQTLLHIYIHILTPK